MRFPLFVAAAVAALSACTPTEHTTHTTAVVVDVPHAHGVYRPPAPTYRASHTVRTIRPDATGAFPGDYAAAWNAKPAYEAAHHGGGTDPRWQDQPMGGSGKYEAPAGKYEAPAGKYTPEGKYDGEPAMGGAAMGDSGAAAGRRPVPGHAAYEAHLVYRPPMDCGIVSQNTPEPWVGERYVCVER